MPDPGRINLVSPEGTVKSVPDDDATVGAYLARKWTPQTSEQAAEADVRQGKIEGYGTNTFLGQLKNDISEGLGGFSLGITQAIEGAGNPARREEMRLHREEHPYQALGSNLLGATVPMVLSGGAAAAGERAAAEVLASGGTEAAAEAARAAALAERPLGVASQFTPAGATERLGARLAHAAEGSGKIAKTARAALGGAFEVGALETGSALGDEAMSKDGLQLDRLIGELPHRFLYGAGFGAGLGAGGKLLELAIGGAGKALTRISKTSEDAAAIPEELAGRSKPELLEMQKAEHARIEAERVPQRQQIANDISNFRNQLAEDRPWDAVSTGSKAAKRAARKRAAEALDEAIAGGTAKGGGAAERAALDLEDAAGAPVSAEAPAAARAPGSDVELGAAGGRAPTRLADEIGVAPDLELGGAGSGAPGDFELGRAAGNPVEDLGLAPSGPTPVPRRGKRFANLREALGAQGRDASLGSFELGPLAPSEAPMELGAAGRPGLRGDALELGEAGAPRPAEFELGAAGGQAAREPAAEAVGAADVELGSAGREARPLDVTDSMIEGGTEVPGMLQSRGTGPAAIPDAPPVDRAPRWMRELEAKYAKADSRLRDVLNNPIGLARDPGKAMEALERQQAALEEILGRKEELQAIHLGDGTGRRAAALKAVPDVLERNKALQDAILQVKAAPASEHLSNLEKAIAALDAPKTLGQKILGGIAYAKVSALAHLIPVVGPMAAPWLGAAAADAVSGGLARTMAKVTRQVGARTTQAVEAFMKGGAIARKAAIPVASKVLEETRFAPAAPAADSVAHVARTHRIRPEEVEIVEDAPRRRARADDVQISFEMGPNEKREELKLMGSRLMNAFTARNQELMSSVTQQPDGRYKARPETRARIAQQLRPIAAFAPITADRLETRAARRLEFLASKSPKFTQLGLVRVPPSEMEVRAFARYVTAAEGPDGIKERLANGTATPEDAETMAELYPDDMNDMLMQIAGQMGTLRKTLPHHRRVALSIFTQQPVDPACDPGVLHILQSKHATEQGTEGGTQAPRPQPAFASVKKSIPSPTPAQERAGGALS